MNEYILPDENEIFIWVHQALIGEIYPDIRLITMNFASNRDLILTYYLDREPCGEDYDNIGSVITRIVSNTSSEKDIARTIERVIFSEERMRDLEGRMKDSDIIMYERMESWL